MPPSEFSRFVRSVLTLGEMEARKIRHDSTELWMRAVQPALWLTIFGTVISSLRSLTQVLNGYTYMQYLAPGVLAQSVIFVAIFYGITIVWERDFGLLTKLLSTPSPRSSIIVGKALAAGVRGIFQGIVVIALSFIIGVNLRFNLLGILGVLAVAVLFAMSFASFSMILASILKTRDRMMGIGQAMTMPLFFASNAIYPVAIMPKWLQVVAAFNPMTYVVNAMRSILLPNASLSGIPTDILALLIFTVLMILIASYMLTRLVE